MVRMAGDFIAALPTGLQFDANYLAGSFRAHVAGNGALTLLLDVDGAAVGMLMARAVRSPWVPITIAEELVFWIDPKHRGRAAFRMLARFDQWARDMECKVCVMTAFDDPRMARIYRRFGFAPASNQPFSKAL